MKLPLLLCLLFFSLTREGVAQDLLHTSRLATSFYSEARFENIEAASTKGSSLLNPSSRDIAFKIPIRSFTFKNGLMQEHFNETYMESDRYPYATFSGKIAEEIDWQKEGSYQVTARGNLSIHGVTTERSLTGVLLIKNGQVVLTSSFLVPVAAHKIDIPNDKISNISQTIQVKLRADYVPKH